MLEYSNFTKIKFAYRAIENNKHITRVYEDAKICKTDYNIFINLCIKIIDKGYKRPMFELDTGETFESFTDRLKEYFQMLELSENYYKREVACRSIENNEDVTRVFKDAKTYGTDYNIFIKICIEIIDKGYKRPIFDLDTGETFESFIGRLNEYFQMLEMSYDRDKCEIAYSTIDQELSW